MPRAGDNTVSDLALVQGTAQVGAGILHRGDLHAVAVQEDPVSADV
jgi:hypothetical protein